MENKDLRDSKCNKGEIKNILVGKFHNHLRLIFSVQKSIRNRKSSLKICLESRNVSFKQDVYNGSFVTLQEDKY